jgi:hypothetical protein
MSKLIRLHLKAIKSSYHTYKVDEGYDDETTETVFQEGKAASKATKITENIAIGFHIFYEKTARLSFDSTGEHQGKPIKEIFQEFLKTL